MAEVASSAPIPSSAPAKKTKPKPKMKKAPASNHPKYSDMIITAVKALRKPKGSSRQAIASYMQANFQIPANSARLISRNLKTMVTNEKLVLASGVGAAGRYKINKAVVTAKKGKSKRKPKAAKKKRGSPKKKSKKPAKKRKSPVKKRAAKRSPKKKAVKKGRKPAKKVAKKKPAKKGKK